MGDQSNKADGAKSNPALLEVDLVSALEAVNRVLDYGAEKYEPGGWMKVEPDRYDAALRRHLRAIAKGEVRDHESGMLHLAHMATNALFLLHFYIQANPEQDYFSFNKPPRNHREVK